MTWTSERSGMASRLRFSIAQTLAPISITVRSRTRKRFLIENSISLAIIRGLDIAIPNGRQSTSPAARHFGFAGESFAVSIVRLISPHCFISVAKYGLAIALSAWTQLAPVPNAIGQ